MSICRAFPGGSRRGSNAGEPPPAARPSMASGWPKVAFSEAMMKSVLWASSLPPPQVAADGERSFTRSGEDHDTDGGPDRDRLDDLGEPCAHLGRDRVVRVRP